ncbi:MAG: Rpn family recombination-promoting nuclease/putative transposase [Clostridia bacterium]|nr:Rpn family recombination-promoting nuclease/putative transposase [Clostridia bacterium]
MANKFNLTNDYLFKRTFGYKGQEHITQIFLRDLFQTEISDVSLDNNTITEKDIMTDKMRIMDIKAVIDGNIQCDIEMQVVRQDDIAKRILFYMSSEYKKTISSGDIYADLKKTIGILITDFEIKISRMCQNMRQNGILERKIILK